MSNVYLIIYTQLQFHVFCITLEDDEQNATKLALSSCYLLQERLLSRKLLPPRFLNVGCSSVVQLYTYVFSCLLFIINVKFLCVQNDTYTVLHSNVPEPNVKIYTVKVTTYTHMSDARMLTMYACACMCVCVCTGM